ncbi:hypothetical protein B0H13DRAFT_2653402 [Mycena leptocephala]|nr:hypothetical protein B0H13DRAFT_2653402 [Mycena leptocephala]
MLSSFITFAVLVCLCATPTQAAAAFRPGTCCFSGVCNMVIPRIMNPVPLSSLAPDITCCCVVGNGAPGSCDINCNTVV